MTGKGSFPVESEVATDAIAAERSHQVHRVLQYPVVVVPQEQQVIPPLEGRRLPVEGLLSRGERQWYLTVRGAQDPKARPSMVNLDAGHGQCRPLVLRVGH